MTCDRVGEEVEEEEEENCGPTLGNSSLVSADTSTIGLGKEAATGDMDVIGVGPSSIMGGGGGGGGGVEMLSTPLFSRARERMSSRSPPIPPDQDAKEDMAQTEASGCVHS